MKIFKNKTVVTIVAGILCVAILGIAYSKRVSARINEITVPIAARDLAAREEIKSEDITEIKVAAEAIKNNVIRSKVQLVDGEVKKYVNFNTNIPKGSFFYNNAVVEWSSMPDSAWSEISDNNTIVSLAVTSTSTYGNSIYPNDKIDIYYTTNDNGKLVLGKLIEGITVLAVKDGTGYHIGQRSSSQREAAALIFSVPEDLHLLLRKAMYLDGSQSLIPVPRNVAYSASNVQTNITSEYLQTLINKRCISVPLDVINAETASEEIKIN